MKKHLIYLGIILVIILGFSLKSHLDIKKWKGTVEDYKKTIINRDILRVDANGVYLKLIDDLNTEKSLHKLVQEQNSELFEAIDKEKGKVKSLTRIVASFKDKDTVTDLPDTAFSEDGESIDFQSFYPTPQNPFVTFTGNINLSTKKLTEGWKFEDIKIDLVVNETKLGLYEALADVPDFMTIGSIEVNSLPMKDPSKEGIGNFGFILGAGISKTFKEGYSTSGVGLAAGIRFKRVTLLLEGDTNQTVGGKVLVEF